ncbi:hypothetical protein PV325_009514 [Microctonus aethiopoides]|uniref:DUF4097 domain-containing protein n=1 Tax=Microctonus aethiopoides TaxID=144406 RepID=A0AA39FUV4_9HYME|nr:hypothetical protein PV325_009514 [Microctonus aethiopoides]KAK0176272.1 hypothetical protein PV328_000423 [Microctonus aethiopoides]
MRLLSIKCLTIWSNINRLCYNTPLNSMPMAVRMCSTKPAILQNITKKVNPFGKLIIDLPFNVEIKPTNPHEYPDMDTLLVKLFSKSSLPMINKSEIISVNVSSVCDIRTIDTENNLNDISCIIEAPIGYDIEAKTIGEGDVCISDMVSNTINVQTEYGNIIVSKLQGKEISLSASEGGSITLKKSIQGDIEVNTAKDGTVDAEKCLGTRLDISTENGDVNVGSNYCEKSTFSTLNGNLLLNNLHMDSAIDINGNGSLNITCLDGSLQANLQEGLAKIQVVRITNDSLIQSSGEIHLNIPEDIDAKLALISGKNLDIDPHISGKFSADGKQFTNDSNGHEFHVETSDIIRVSQTSWMESLKLGKCSK